jgi:hypothetical protein
MNAAVDYEDIPKDELKALRRSVFRENRTIRWWNAVAAGVAALVAIPLSMAVFPGLDAIVVRWVMGCILMLGLNVIFSEAVTEPRIRRAVERKRRLSQLSESAPGGVR